MAGHKLKEPSNREARRFNLKATILAASALAPSTKSNYGQAWGRFHTYCENMGLDPTEASEPDVATWGVLRCEQTTSLNMIEANLNAVKCFWCYTNNTISDIPLDTVIKRGQLKIMEAKDLNHLGLEPEHMQCLIHSAIYKFGPQNFMV